MMRFRFVEEHRGKVPTERLCEIMDWHSRKVLSWRLSNSMEADFCVEALSEAMARYGKPGIMDSDHPSHGLQANHERAAGQPVHRL